MYVRHEFDAEKMMMNSFVLTKSKSIKEEGKRVEKVLMPFRCAGRRIRRALRWHLCRLSGCLLPQNAANDALGCASLEWLSAEGKEKKTEVNRLE